ncbi:MAG TPA: N-acyl homoserine lactonase family protein [Rhizomicrobium sp.]
MSVHRIHAIRYARHERVAADNFIGGGAADDHDAPMPLDYFVWAIERADAPPIVVDTGFGEEAAQRRGRTMLRPVEDGLRAVGIAPEDVAEVVLTHLHYDHAGSLDLFPNARFHIQEGELAFATGKAMLHRHVRAPFDCEPVAQMVRLLFGERLVFHAGDAEIAPGVTLRLMAGHTAGLQAVEVATARGAVILASDACHLYANLLREVPFPIVVDVPAYLDALARLRGLAESLAHIIPGHDPLVLSVFPGGAAEDVARVDLEPHRAIEEFV